MALRQVPTPTKKTLKSPERMQGNQGFMSGETGIRTLGTLAGTPVFKTGAIGHSAISPGRMLRRSACCVNDDTLRSDTKAVFGFEPEKESGCATLWQRSGRRECDRGMASNGVS